MDPSCEKYLIFDFDFWKRILFFTRRVHDSALHCWHDVIVGLMVTHCYLIIMYIWLAHWASDMDYAKLLFLYLQF